ncbi:aminotransferase class I/II-fold pyridoxal phosphate-dependent enzyme [Paroceanicella profunda]|uniref:Aminotransferase class I/II-fold pyridoxal phosphate-dependent enzyme n=1 Tax=Paroceanicella profunda TaxID=2579971 RepID=A0A5B8FS78_9RHOB|nr:aminotransferase class I/II-fold pyridoxal phosphate-dependent enzyme [Paroceanicella profunda]QDL91215.1 aminotransferase class I/II-fold pyridoxal phosphate-dependent enzyme [Paroceanicella profunda]
MQFPERYSSLPEYAFPRLRALLDGVEPGREPIAMSLGEPKHPAPPFLGEVLAAHVHEYSVYPPNDGHPELLEAISAWLARRYGVAVDAEREIMPLNGTREGLFAACLALSPERKTGARPVVLLPNPFYQCYAVAAITAGAEPVYVPATAETGFLPDFAAVPAELLARTTVVYMCSPANPQGAVADAAYWQRLADLAETHDFRVFADECYSEIWRTAPPPGALQADAARERILAFHSLSKRSSLPGLRSGFVTGGPRSIAALRQLRAYVGAPLPLPAQRAAAACWRDEAHVEASRALYQRKFALADDILGNLPGYHAPEGGFFLWVGVEDDVAATRRLWREAGVKVLPGSYLSRESDARLGGGNPGAGYIRVALVAQEAEVARGLTALRDTLR